ncbi:MAG TPA: amidophosphoribosyltransferase, partial [Telluria sp.]|nr:amidophosphoribosyltransferase [Telluria sp.]
MCGIVGVVSHSPVNQQLYDALLLLQHRGQDAAGIATTQNSTFSMYKANGLVRDVFRTRNMRSLLGNTGIAHVRYPTAGSSSEEEAQPFYVNAPFGITLAHNGNLTNWEQLKIEMFKNDRRHINTDSDSEVLLNVLAHEIQEASTGFTLDPAAVFKAVAVLHKRVRGAYAAVAQIAGYGLLAFRDPFGIRPLCIGVLESDKGANEYMVASESVALEGLGYRFLRDIAPGEAVFVDMDGHLHSKQCADNPSLNPCAFEYVYLARPDSILDGASVYATRLKMGEYLADKIRAEIPSGEIDVVMPIPDSSRPAAIQLALKLGIEYREGFIKN